MGYEIRSKEDWAINSEENLRIAALEPHKLGWLIGFDKLNRFHSRWIHYIWESNKPKALQAFRGSYKSTAIVIVGTIRWMLFHPDERILINRKSFTTAAEYTKAISRAMQTTEIAELFKQAHGRYPKTKVDREGELTFNFKSKITPEGNVTGKGIDQDITGQHYDKIISDDFVTWRDRISRAERERTIAWVQEVATNIIDPGKGSGWIGTPWDTKDAWSLIRGFATIDRYKLSKYNFIGKEAAERKRRTTTPFLFDANYELELGKDESRLFSEPLWPRRWDYAVRGAIAQLDTAFDGDHYCALTIAAPTRKEGDNQFYQAVGFTYPGNVEDWEEDIVKLCDKYKAKHIWVEDNADKGACSKRLRGRGLTVKGYSEGMNKHVKIGAYLYPAWKYIEWAEETGEQYLSQVVEYKEGVSPDDAPDSAASLFKQEFSNGGAMLDDEARGFFHGGG